MLKPYYCNIVSHRGYRSNIHLFAESKEQLEAMLAAAIPPYTLKGASQMVYEPVDKEAVL